MKKILKIVAIVLVVGFVVAQFFRPNRVNPPVVEANTLEASTEVPDEVKAIISRSCADCHSNTTRYPLYSNISPVSWFLVDHVEHGRSHLNFSQWNAYSALQKGRKLEEICEQLESGAMPLGSYLWLHWDAALSAADSRTLCGWATREREKLGS
jgi:hypothetical protein